MSAFTEYLSQVRPAVEEALEGWLRRQAAEPSELHEAMRYAVMGPGKRVRPALVLAAAEACGGRREQAMPAACAAEMVHAYSLVHDDLPAMDDDAVRRGRPTVHVEFGEALAILAGDALLTLAFEVLVRGGVEAAVPADIIAMQVLDLAAAAGASGMVFGQAEDIKAAAEGCNAARLHAIELLKTGHLLAACAVMGARSAGADDGALAAMREYGLRLGAAYQLADDMHDAGKDAGDEALFPDLVGMDASREMADSARREAKAALSAFGDRADVLRSLADFAVEREA